MWAQRTCVFEYERGKQRYECRVALGVQEAAQLWPTLTLICRQSDKGLTGGAQQTYIIHHLHILLALHNLTRAC